MLGMVALAVDYAYLLNVKTDLQRAADAAALAAVRDLEPTPTGSQDVEKVKATLREYAAENLGVTSFTVLDSDIQIGRYDPATVYTNFTILNDGIYDTVKVTLRYDNKANSPVSLFFARVMGIKTSNVVASATAVLQKATILKPGAEVLPVTIPASVWDSRDPGETWSLYNYDPALDVWPIVDALGLKIPGNWGTVDIGPDNNSSADINNQILDGLRQSDLDALFNAGRIPTNEHIDSTYPWLSSADTGDLAGFQTSLDKSVGRTKLVPIFEDPADANQNGENTEFRVVRWGVVKIVSTSLLGLPLNRHLTVQKTYTYDSRLFAQKDLSNATSVIDGAYTTPVLIE
jgi:hypothetical protein